MHMQVSWDSDRVALAADCVTLEGGLRCYESWKITRLRSGGRSH